MGLVAAACGTGRGGKASASTRCTNARQSACAGCHRGTLCLTPAQEFQVASHVLSRRAMQPTQSVVTFERWAGVAMASAVVAYGLSRRSLAGVALAATAVPLAYRGATGAWPFVPGTSDTRTALGGERGIHVRDAVRLEIPIEAAYGFWRRLENLPRVMS